MFKQLKGKICRKASLKCLIYFVELYADRTFQLFAQHIQERARKFRRESVMKIKFENMTLSEDFSLKVGLHSRIPNSFHN